MSSTSKSDIQRISNHVISAHIDDLYRVSENFRYAINELPIIQSTADQEIARSILTSVIRDSLHRSNEFQHFDPVTLVPLLQNRIGWQQSRLLNALSSDSLQTAPEARQRIWNNALKTIPLLAYEFAQKLQFSLDFLFEVAREVDDAISSGHLTASNLSFRFDLGDFHQGNRSTLEVHDKAAAKTWFYKPRPSKTEDVMHSLLAASNLYQNLRIPAVRQGKFGHWAVGIEADEKSASCYDLAVAQLVHFCMAFNLTDIHADNYIKVSDNIYIIDGETFFASRPSFVSGEGRSSYGDVYDVFATTVVASEFDINLEPIDGTGLRSFFARDEFNAARMERVLDRFRKMDDELGSLYAEKWEKHQLEDCRFRYLHRDTKAYFWALDMLAHPHSLKGSAYLTESAELALGNFLGAGGPESCTLGQSELRQLLRGDVPYFFRKFGSQDLFDDSGLVMPDFFDQVHIEKIEEKYSERFHHQSSNLAKLKLSLSIEMAKQDAEDVQYAGEPFEIADQILDEGRLQTRDALPYWVGIYPSFDGEIFRILPTQPLDFYAGSMGIIGAQAVRDRVSQSSAFPSDLHALEAHLASALGDNGLSIGVCSDILRFLWMCEKHIDNVNNHLDTVLSQLARLPNPTGDELDLLSGWAGLFSLLSHWKTASEMVKRNSTSEPFRHRLETLLAEFALLVDQKIDEMEVNPGEQRSYGMAHGVAGYLQALHDISVASYWDELDPLLQHSLSELLSKVTKFVERRVELRISDDKDMRWCNGKLGELLAVLQATENQSLADYAAEWALEKKELVFEKSHFCCGEAGFLYFQYVLTKHTQVNAQLKADVRKQMNQRAESLEQHFRTQALKFGIGVDQYSANPMLFTGITGVALVLQLVKSPNGSNPSRGPWLRNAPL